MWDDGKVLTQHQHFRPGIIPCGKRNTDSFRGMDIECRNLAQFDIDIETNRFDSLCFRFSDPGFNKASIRVHPTHQMSRQLLCMRNCERIHRYALAGRDEICVSHGCRPLVQAGSQLR